MDSRQPSTVSTHTTFRTTWMNRLIVSLVILIWTFLGLIFFWLIDHVIGAVLSFVIASLLAYTLYPAVKFLQRFLPRTLDILLVYVVGFGALCVLPYHFGRHHGHPVDRADAVVASLTGLSW